ncbi:DIS1B-like protein [Mya arenaria]|uniref:DIS1B-like protein n=1 Tax=Mya arenaria TaxID=6604 RepID=A0ABY7EN45_MYAAR|nr:DIS1B-like protein [Mya arenaria]
MTKCMISTCEFLFQGYLGSCMDHTCPAGTICVSAPSGTMARYSCLQQDNCSIAMFCPATSDIYGQVQFNGLNNVVGVALQGRHDYDQFVTAYKVFYSGDCVFNGNTDKDTIVTSMLPSDVTALCVRLNPVKWNEHISLSVGFERRRRQLSLEENCFEKERTKYVYSMLITFLFTPTDF